MPLLHISKIKDRKTPLVTLVIQEVAVHIQIKEVVPMLTKVAVLTPIKVDQIILVMEVTQVNHKHIKVTEVFTETVNVMMVVIVNHQDNHLIHKDHQQINNIHHLEVPLNRDIQQVAQEVSLLLFYDFLLIYYSVGFANNPPIGFNLYPTGNNQPYPGSHSTPYPSTDMGPGFNAPPPPSAYPGNNSYGNPYPSQGYPQQSSSPYPNASHGYPQQTSSAYPNLGHGAQPQQSYPSAPPQYQTAYGSFTNY